MSYGKFHESEGLAAISRAIRAKKEKQDEKDHADVGATGQSGPSLLGASSDLGNSRNKENVKKNTNGNEDEKAEFPGESIAADKPMKKQKKAKAKKHVGSEEKDDPSRSSDDGGAERSKEKLHAADSTLCPKTRKKTDKKKRRPEAALGQDAAADVEPVASTGAKKAKKGNNNAGQADAVAIEDKDQQGPVHRLFRVMYGKHAAAEAGLRDITLPAEGMGLQQFQDQVLDSVSRTGARAVGLLLSVARRCSELKSKPKNTNNPLGMRRGSAHFSTAEEALHTEKSGMVAKKLWNSILQCNADAMMSARKALRASGPSFLEAAQSHAHENSQPRWKTFGEFYRASFVDAYAQDLEDMRTAANVRPVKPELLLKCMQAGIPVFTEADRRLLLLPANGEVDDSLPDTVGGVLCKAPHF